MTGRDLADRVVEEFGTRKVNEIAERAGLSIRFGSWHPVTAGEFDVVARVITVNEHAEQDAIRIIAHELGHYFLRRGSVQCGDIERFSDDFADALAETDGP